jgi:hypothetical protein
VGDDGGQGCDSVALMMSGSRAHTVEPAAPVAADSAAETRARVAPVDWAATQRPGRYLARVPAWWWL